MFQRCRTLCLILFLIFAVSGCASTSVRETGEITGAVPVAGPEQKQGPDPQETNVDLTHDPYREKRLLMAEIKRSLDSGADIGPEKAEELLLQVPGSSYGRYLAGVIYSRNGEIENAKTQFKRSSQLEPGSDHAFTALGQIYQESGDFTQADLYFSKAYEAALTPLTANRLALLRIQGGYVESAREILENTLNKYPDSAMTRNNLAIALDLLGTTSKGIEILAGDGITDTRLLQTRASLELKEGHPDRAISDLDTGTDTGDPNRHWLLKGIADLQLGDLDQAEEKFRSAIDGKPSNYEGYLNLGMTLRRQGRFVEASRIYKEGLAKASHHDLHLNLGVLYELYRGEPALALEQYQEYLRLGGPASDRVRGWAEYLEGVLEGP